MGIYEDLAEQLGVDLSDPTNALARDLVEADDQLLEDLVALRKALKLKPAEVARRMGRDRSAVTQFEKLTADPKLSTIRRYALAIGARITHDVERADQVPRTQPTVDIAFIDLREAAVNVGYSAAGESLHTALSIPMDACRALARAMAERESPVSRLWSSELSQL